MPTGYYYFKFKPQNQGYEIWRNSGGKLIDLSIYYGLWKTGGFANGSYKQNHKDQSTSQIETFFELINNFHEVYFFLFLKGTVEIFHSNKLQVYDGPAIYDDYETKNGQRMLLRSHPKSISAEPFKSLDKKDVPEYFATINSNQKYNRGTIKKFEGVEEELAEKIVKGGTISINKGNFLEYLSPIQFETLAFLIFNHNGNMCSSFRGGTLPDYDLRVYINDPRDLYPPVTSGQHWVQVKLNKTSKVVGGCYLFTSEALNEPFVLDKKWILSQLAKRSDISDWLKGTVFNHALYQCSL